jgi:hypothetical protein
MQALKKDSFEDKIPTIDSSESRDRFRSVKPKSILVGSFWMLGITLALFFLPLVNGLM